MFISEKSFVYFGRLFYTVLTINLPTVYAGSSLKFSKIQPEFILNICSFSSFAQFGFWIKFQTAFYPFLKVFIHIHSFRANQKKSFHRFP